MSRRGRTSSATCVASLAAIGLVVSLGACGDEVADDAPAERLPPPPPGARVCRVDYRTRTTQYVGASPAGDRQLLRYYRRALEAENCSTEDPEAASGDLSAAGSLALPFECPEGKGSIVATRSGASYSIAWRG